MSLDLFINTLNRNIDKITKLPIQSIRIEKLFECYDRLLFDNNAWLEAKNWLSKKKFITRDDLRNLATDCSTSKKAWSVLFIVTMLWGYGEKDDSGPVKLYFALKTPDASRIINNTAGLISLGKLTEGFLEIRKLNEIGGSYGTKYLFSVGLAFNLNPRPLVLDRKVEKSLKALWGDDAEKYFRLKERTYTYEKGAMRAADGYLKYCIALETAAAKLTNPVTPVLLEQFLFEADKTNA